MAAPIKLETQEERELWKSVCIAIASTYENTNRPSMHKCEMHEWADKAIEYFRERTAHETGR